MDLSKLQSLYYFDKLIEKTINSASTEKYEMSIYRNNIKADRTGKYIELFHKKHKKKIYPWLGVFYNENDLNIYVNYRVEEGWCDTITGKMHKNEELTIKFTEKFKNYNCEFWENAIWIGMNKDDFDNFNKANTKKQAEILETFYYKILNITETFFI